MKDSIVQVCCSGLTGSMSELVQTCGGAMAEDCFGSSHADSEVSRATTVSFLDMAGLSSRPVPMGRSSVAVNIVQKSCDEQCKN